MGPITELKINPKLIADWEAQDVKLKKQIDQLENAKRKFLYTHDSENSNEPLYLKLYHKYWEKNEDKLERRAQVIEQISYISNQFIQFINRVSDEDEIVYCPSKEIQPSSYFPSRIKGIEKQNLFNDLLEINRLTRKVVHHIFEKYLNVSITCPKEWSNIKCIKTTMSKRISGVKTYKKKKALEIIQQEDRTFLVPTTIMHEVSYYKKWNVYSTNVTENKLIFTPLKQN